MNNAIFSAVVAAPFGAMGIRSGEGLLRQMCYLPPSHALAAPTDAVAELAARQLEAYFADPDHPFDLPLAQVGTPFQRRVWAAIRAIPRGEVRTYGKLASEMGDAVARAVGQACGDNYFPLVVPCHRVTSARGLGGFSHDGDENGYYLAVKRWLLNHEGVTTGVPWQQQAMAF